LQKILQNIYYEMMKRKRTIALAMIGVAAIAANAQTDTTVVEKESKIGEVRVTGIRKKNTEAAMISALKMSDLVTSNISAQEIKKTQDNNAGEVIRRIPGVSIIDEKFVMVRGLSQRYNNVWINGGAVPSSEADSRAFSFDIIPSSQIDNLTIVKSPTSEYPADFTGGFIIVNTTDIPSANSFGLSVGGNWNDASAFTNFKKFSSGWKVDEMSPWGDLKLGANVNHRWTIGDGQLGMIAAVNFTNEYRTYKDMANNLFGIYNETAQKSNYLRQSTDNQYNHNNRLGALFNMTYLSPSGNNKYEFKNIFNRLATKRYTDRYGLSAQSDYEASAEYLDRSRITYNSQFTGKHSLEKDEIDWNASYSYANRRMPDRKRYMVSDAQSETAGDLQLVTGNDISKETTTLDEHILSASVNETHDFSFLKLKVGAYGEYRSRKYETEEYWYSWNPSNCSLLPSNFRRMDMVELLSNDSYYGDQGLYLIQHLDMTNNYRGKNTLGAGYVAASLPLGKLSVNAGLRYEYNRMELISNLKAQEKSESSKFYDDNDIFPSLNATYRFNDQHQVRASYGRSVNRPEFREVSPSVYYDFDLASNVMGYSDLKSCYIDNVDLRYEWYPSRGEMISLAAFYKRFKNPIEWTYTVAGGTDLVYSFMNAESADNYGLELDLRKSLDFIGLRHFSLLLNASLISSHVNFPAGSKEEDRPMQGQSPYLVNAGIFYSNPAKRLNISLMYNRIGKRIIGVGRVEGSTGDNESARIPDSYEMPRDAIDFSFSKTFFDHLELKLNVRDLLAQKVTYKQFVETKNGEVEQITREYKPGRNIGVTVGYRF